MKTIFKYLIKGEEFKLDFEVHNINTKQQYAIWNLTFKKRSILFWYQGF
jgi:hypothetical protein